MPRENAKPLVTAVIPVYNHQNYVLESIRAIIGQDYPNIELIIINDGSTDRSDDMVQIVVEECKRRFSCFTYISRENKGLSATLNQALEMAKGEYFSAVASDDVILPAKFSLLVEAMEARGPSCAGAFGNASFIDEHGVAIFLDMRGYVVRCSQTQRVFGTYVDFYLRNGRFGSKSEIGTYKRILRLNPFPGPSSVLRTACIKQVRGWTEGNPIEDWEMWLKLAKQYSLLYVDEIVALYRSHGQNTCHRDNAFGASTAQMTKAGIKLIEQEKEFCFRENMIAEWEDSYYSLIYWLLRYGDLSLGEKIRALNSAKPVPFVLFLAIASLKRLSERFGSK